MVDTLLAFDHFTRRMHVIGMVPMGSDSAKKEGYRTIDEILSALKSDIKIPRSGAKGSDSDFKSNFTRECFEKIVEDARKNMRNWGRNWPQAEIGDNLSR